MPRLRSCPLWLGSSASSWHRMRLRFRTYAFYAVPFGEMASTPSQQSVAFFLQACAAIVARAAWPRSSQIAGAVVHTTLEWIGATQGWKDLDFFVESKARVVESLVQVLRHVSGGLVRQRAWCRPCNSDEGKTKAPRGVHVAVREWFRLVKSESTVNLYLFSDGSLEGKGRKL